MGTGWFRERSKNAMSLFLQPWALSVLPLLSQCLHWAEFTLTSELFCPPVGPSLLRRALLMEVNPAHLDIATSLCSFLADADVLSLSALQTHCDCVSEWTSARSCEISWSSKWTTWRCQCWLKKKEQLHFLLQGSETVWKHHRVCKSTRQKLNQETSPTQVIESCFLLCHCFWHSARNLALVTVSGHSARSTYRRTGWSSSILSSPCEFGCMDLCIVSLQTPHSISK